MAHNQEHEIEQRSLHRVNWVIDKILERLDGLGVYTDEQAQDAIAAMLVAGTHSGITITYDDAGNRESLIVVDTALGSKAGVPVPADLPAGRVRVFKDTSVVNGNAPYSLWLNDGGTLVNLTARASLNRGDIVLTDAASIATDASTGNSFTVTLAGNRTLANPTNLVQGATYQWRVKQDATGSRTLAYGTNFKWGSAGAPTLTTTANALDIITATTDGTNLFCTIVKGY